MNEWENVSCCCLCKTKSFFVVACRDETAAQETEKERKVKQNNCHHNIYRENKMRYIHNINKRKKKGRVMDMCKFRNESL